MPGLPDGSYHFLVSKGDFFLFNSINVDLSIIVLALYVILTTCAIVRKQFIRMIMGCIGIGLICLWMFYQWLPNIPIFTPIDPANPGQFLGNDNLANNFEFYRFLLMSALYFALTTLSLVEFYYSIYSKKKSKSPELMIPIELKHEGLTDAKPDTASGAEPNLKF